MLVKFDARRKHRVTADSSQYALGAALLQREELNWLPVCYASRMLTDTEKRYARIEKEALAVVWACQKFDFYLVGRLFEIETDHKLLVPLLRDKDLSNLPLRVQQLKLRMVRHDYSIFYRPGASMNLADGLFQAFYPDPKYCSQEEKVEAHVFHLVASIQVACNEFDRIRDELPMDPACKIVMQFAQTSWLSKRDVPLSAGSCYQFKDKLYVHDGLLL